MPIKLPFRPRKDAYPSDLWTKCPGCGEMLFNKQIEKTLRVCPGCGHHFRVSARGRLEQLLDPHSFAEQDAGLQSVDALAFVDSKAYPDRLAAAQAVFGAAVKPVYHFAKAKRILSIDADFLQSEAGAIANIRGFSKGRRVTKKDDAMNRLYVAESALTLTGSMADHRLRVATSHMLALTAKLVAAAYPAAESAVAPFTQGLNVDVKWVEACVADLMAHRGAALAVAGSHLPAEIHALVYGLNTVLGAIGETVTFVQAEVTPASSSVAALAAAIKGGSVKTLVVLGGNPAYNADRKSTRLNSSH